MRTPIEIARLEEARLAAGVRDIVPEAVAWAGGSMCYAGPGSWANAVYGAGMNGPVSTADFDELDAFYRERAAGEKTAVKVELCPYADETLLRGLIARGFGLSEMASVMAMELSGADGAAGGARDLGRGVGHGVGRAVDPPVEVRRLERGDEAGLRAYATLAHDAFEGGGEIPEAEWGIRQRMLAHGRTVMLTAWSGGTLVGVAAMEVAGEVAAMFGGTVLEPFRRRGIHRLLIEERVRIAREAGASVAVIESDPGGATERNAERVGFRVVYSKAAVSRVFENDGN
ncbi:MAG: GNAT family N-acetyltransferase [Planctomycetota bacterium]